MSKYLSTERDITSEIDEALERIDWNVVDDKIGMIELCQGRDEDGRDFWAYLCLYPSKYKEYKERSAKGEALSPLDFGEALRTGWGTYPSEETQREMEEKYGLNHETFLEDDIKERLRSADKKE